MIIKLTIINHLNNSHFRISLTNYNEILMIYRKRLLLLWCDNCYQLFVYFLLRKYEFNVQLYYLNVFLIFLTIPTITNLYYLLTNN